MPLPLRYRVRRHSRGAPPAVHPPPVRPHVEELESRLAPSAGFNVPLITDPGVQQMPSVAVDPHDADHLVVVYMDYSLRTTGYAGIGVRVSHDGGATWQHSIAGHELQVPLPAGFDEGAGQPIVQFAPFDKQYQDRKSTRLNSSH